MPNLRSLYLENHYPTTEQQDKRKSGSILDRCAHGRVWERRMQGI